jgi:CubicO group peptidase (beta-lactamase class C family)
MIRCSRVVALALCATFALAAPGSGQVLLYSLFERYIDSLRQQTGIPGMSALILKNGQVEWERGFGQQDVERNVLAAPDTPYPVGDLTQTVAAVLLGACAEQGQLNIDEPVRRWVADFPSATATVRQVMAHASATPSGGEFQYDPGRFGALAAVIQGCTPKPFRAHLADSVLERLGMAGSVPGEDLSSPSSPYRELFDAPRLQRYDAVLDRMALPYRVDRNLRATRSAYRPSPLTASAGLVSTVRDLARFDTALDEAVLLRPESLGVAWSPANFTGTPLPTGLGWFVQDYQGERIIWHFSHVPDAYSALILKMPARQLTLIMLANSDGLSTGANLERGDVTASPFVKIFLRLFAS